MPTGWSIDGRRILFESAAPSSSLGEFDISSGKKFEIAANSDRSFHSARFSPDGRWIAFDASSEPGTKQIYIAPHHPGERVNPGDWIAITNGRAMDTIPAWGPHGDKLYFISERDGLRCIWAQRLDPRTKRPLGEPYAVQHFHGARRTLLRYVDDIPAAVGLSVAGDRMVVSVDEVSGNVWMVKPDWTM